MTLKRIKTANKISEQDQKALQEAVSEILKKVQKEGDSALRYYEKKFDNFEPKTFRVSRLESAKAKTRLPAEVIEELDFAMEKVRAFSEAQRACLKDFESEIYPGMSMGHRVIPVASCGCYVPAGRYPCLTAAVMSVMPAKVAGVKRIIACCPPGENGGINDGILYTLHQMEVDEIYCLGGAQAIGAMGYGTETIKAVDLIVGPGNQYVREAKRQIFGTCGIDFLAGPSEVQIIADDSASADLIAADLLAQCEHDPNARASLVTTSQALGMAVVAEIETQLKVLKTEQVARASWENNGEIVVCEDLAACAYYANEYAPEHLEIHTKSPRELMGLLDSYGSLFLGELTAEVYADKISGTNHSLPTGRAARYTGGLWVGMYLKVITHQHANLATSLMLAKYAETQSTFEKMDAHRYAATIRLQKFGK